MYTTATSSGKILQAGSLAGSLAGAVVEPPQFAILNEVNGKLMELIERGYSILGRQRNFVDRVVGAIPESTGVGNKAQEPMGIANSIIEKLSVLDGIFNEISGQTARMEGIA